MGQPTWQEARSLALKGATARQLGPTGTLCDVNSGGLQVFAVCHPRIARTPLYPAMPRC